MIPEIEDKFAEEISKDIAIFITFVRSQFVHISNMLSLKIAP
jgi:hypothetical protein